MIKLQTETQQTNTSTNQAPMGRSTRSETTAVSVPPSRRGHPGSMGRHPRRTLTITTDISGSWIKNHRSNNFYTFLPKLKGANFLFLVEKWEKTKKFPSQISLHLLPTLPPQKVRGKLSPRVPRNSVPREFSFFFSLK